MDSRRHVRAATAMAHPPERAEGSESTGRALAPPKAEGPVPPPSSQLLTVEDAAKLLSTTPTALRARCRRHARRIGREVTARLGAGVVAFKFGASWRLRIDPP